MELNKIIKKSMVDNDIEGKMQLVERSGISYTVVTKIMNGDGSVKLTKVVELLSFLGYQLKAEVK